MGLASSFDEPYYSGGVVTQLTPHPYDVAIDGHGYFISLEFTPFRREAFRYRSIPKNRPQADTGGVPGEQTVNPAGAWRRSQESWHHGAGQTYLDHKTSDPDRFRRSKGVDVWTQWQLEALPDTTLSRASIATNLILCTVGNVLYLADGATLLKTSDMVTWTAVTGTPGAVISSMATDGYNLWLTCGTSGVYSTTRSASSAAIYAGGPGAGGGAADDIIGYANGRLMLGHLNAMYNIVTTGALPSPILTMGNTDFRWVGFVGGRGQMYAAGFSGTSSIIHRINIKTDGSGIDAPVVAGLLPAGETVRSIVSYLGLVLLGSDLGVRFAQAGTNADPTSPDLTIGSLITGTRPNTYGPTLAVNAFEGQGQWVWFGWSNYDSGSTGLGRVDLTAFINPTTPAYASDLMAATQGAVTSIATFLGGRVFGVAGSGVWAQAATYVAVGTLEPGLVTYDLSDLKTPVFLDLLPGNEGGTITAYLALEDGTFTLVGTTGELTDGNLVTLPTQQTQGHQLSLKLQFNSDGSGCPALKRQTLRSIVAAVAGTEILVPIQLAESVVSRDDLPVRVVPADEYVFLDGLRQSGRIVTYQQGSISFSVTVEDLDYTPEHFGLDKTDLNGILVATLHTVT